MDDVKTLSDEQLETNRREIEQERARREKLAQIPAALAGLVIQFREAGGDPSDLSPVITDPEAALAVQTEEQI